ncbi:MAG: hypothetical protein GY898_22920 [Proteobacteria bacterium]|nr:hypothetical protein [Pseudomonadota bacterium]
MGRLLPILFAWAALTGCVAGELRDLTPREVRLGLPRSSEPRPLDPPEEREARGFLLGTPLTEVGDDGSVRLEVLLAGSMPRLARVRWTAEGGVLTDDGLTATLVPDGPWMVRAELLQAEQRVLDRISMAGEPGGIPVTATWNRLLVGRLPAGGELEVVPPLVDGAMTPGQTVSLRARLPDGTTTPWSTATAGGLLGAGDLAPWPAARSCDDVAFPARIGTGHVACGADGGLTTFRSRTRAEDLALVRPGSQPEPITPPAGASSVVEGPDGGIVVAGEYLGGWRDDGTSFARFLGDRAVRGRPASDGITVAFARADRVEVGAWDSPARVQLPARPADVERPVAVGFGWVAIVEGRLGHERLRLQDTAGRRSATLATTLRPREPGFAGTWAWWLTADGLEALSLEGRARIRSPVEAAPGRPAALDDWLLTARRGSGLHAVHLPTGLTAELPTGGLTQLRGAAAGRATTAQQPADGADRLVGWSTALRLFEEDGGATSGSIPRQRAGGHGGSTGVLLPEGERTLRFDPGPGGGTLEAWISDLPGPWAAIEVTVGGPDTTGIRATPQASPEGPGRWVRLTELPAAPRTPIARRIVDLTWTAGPEGGLIDAIRLLPPQLTR